MTAVAKANGVPIDFERRNGAVVVTPEDESSFALAVETAYCRSCPLFQDRALFRAQFEHMLQKLAQWLAAHEEEVVQALVTLRGAALELLLVRKSTGYDADFEDELSDLDIAIAQDPNLNLISLGSIALPHCSPDALASFVNPELSLVFRHAQ